MRSGATARAAPSRRRSVPRRCAAATGRSCSISACAHGPDPVENGGAGRARHRMPRRAHRRGLWRRGVERARLRALSQRQRCRRRSWSNWCASPAAIRPRSRRPRRMFEPAGLEVAVCADQAGRIIDRLVRPKYNAALRLLDEGLASAEAMDTTCRLGLGYPDGPIERVLRGGLAASLRSHQRAVRGLRQRGLCAGAPRGGRQATPGQGRLMQPLAGDQGASTSRPFCRARSRP